VERTPDTVLIAQPRRGGAREPTRRLLTSTPIDIVHARQPVLDLAHCCREGFCDQQSPTRLNVLGEGLMPESIGHFFVRRSPELRQIETGPVPEHFDVREGASFTPDNEGLELDSLDTAGYGMAEQHGSVFHMVR